MLVLPPETANSKSTVIKDGFLKTSDICTGKFAADCKSAGLT